MELPSKWITVGIERIHEKFFKPVRNQIGINKPLGGLWSSPLIEDIEGNMTSAWREWSSENMALNYRIATVFALKESANIFIIDSQDDLIRLFREVGELSSPFTMFKYLNYEKAAEKYDGIYLTQEGQWSTHLPMHNTEYNLYGYDVESLVLFNMECIQEQYTVKL